MAKQRMIVVLIACLTLAVFTGGSLSRRPTRRLTFPDAQSLRGLTQAEASEFMKKWMADQMLQRRISNYEYSMARRKQAWKNELRVSEAQWKIIEPKYERQIQLMKDTGARSSSENSRDSGHHWIKPTEDNIGRPVPPTFAELSEAYRNADKLVDLLRREDTTDEELRKQIDALQRAREKARRELPKARRELAAALTTPRQEAVFLLIGFID